MLSECVDEVVLLGRSDPPLAGVLGVTGWAAATVCVANVSAPTFSPQDGQKRLLSANSVPQDAHFAIGVSQHRGFPYATAHAAVAA